MSRTLARVIVALLASVVVGVVVLVVVALRNDDEVEVSGTVGRLSRERTFVVLEGVQGLEGADDVLEGGPLDGDSLTASLVNPSEDVEVGQEVTGTYLEEYDILYVN